MSVSHGMALGASSVPMMAAMMLPSAVPAIVHRARARVSSGVRFGVYCVGSSIGLMIVLIALDAMSIALMGVIAALVLAQKLLPPRPIFDVPIALLIVALGIAVAAN